VTRGGNEISLPSGRLFPDSAGLECALELDNLLACRFCSRASWCLECNCRGESQRDRKRLLHRHPMRWSRHMSVCVCGRAHKKASHHVHEEGKAAARERPETMTSILRTKEHSSSPVGNHLKLNFSSLTHRLDEPKLWGGRGPGNFMFRSCFM
jgi:hypothetical protein